MVLDRKRISRSVANMFVGELQGAHPQLTSWVQIGLQKPHVRPPQLVGPEQLLWWAAVSYGMRRKV
jgi:hypothetical protein